MKRSRFGRNAGLPREADELLWFSNGLADSGSRAEDSFWELGLIKAVEHLLATGKEDVLTQCLEHLFKSNPRSYEVLADCIETRSEQARQGEHEVILIAAPILAWSRFAIPASTIPADTLSALRVHLQAHVLAEGVKLGLADALFSPDQLPQGYCATAHFTAAMLEPTLAAATLHIDTESLPATTRFLSDLRYVLAAVEVKPGRPVFRWQEADGSKLTAQEQWSKQGGACLLPLLAGCAMEVVLPDAFFSACRESDRQSRPYSVRASAAFLSTTLDLTPGDLRAVVAAFHDEQLEEYRIGFTTSKSSTVVHGVVWPLLGPEDEIGDVPAQITQALKESGVTRIEFLENRFQLEFCDDCGAPMYPSPEGELVHAELPEDKAEQIPRHLH